MNPITNVVVALFGAEQKQILRITGTDKNNANISITDANVMTGSFGIDRYSCNGDKLEIGTAIAAQMTCKLNNADGTFDNIVFEGTELLVEIGIADWNQTNPTINYVPCGYFTPDEQPRRLSTISLTCLDRMTKFDAVVDPTALTLPATVAGLVGQVCTICGITLSRDISSLTNASVSITALPTVQGDMTYRNLIQWCAGIMATNAWINWSGNLEFSWYNNSTSYMMTTANRYNSDLYEDDLTVTGVTYTNNSGVEIVEGTDDYAIDLTGNALAGPLISTVLPAINTALNGFTYRPFSAAVVNAPYLWPMDVVVYKDKDGNNHTSVLTNVAFGLNGTTALESRGMTAAMNARKQPKGVTKEQAQIITEAMQAVEADIDESLTQQEIFNRLTDGGQNQGIYLLNGKVYVDATYILTGYLEATRIKGGTLTLGGLNNVNGTMEVLDASGNVVGTITKDGIFTGNSTSSAVFNSGILKFEQGNDEVGRIWPGALSGGSNFMFINGPESSGSQNRSALNFWGNGDVSLLAGDEVAALNLHADGSIGINSSDDISTTADGDISETADGTLHLHSGGGASLYLTAAGNAELRSDGGAAMLILKPDGSIYLSHILDMGKNASNAAGNIIQWTTADDTVFSIRPYNNLFQIVRTPSGGTSTNALGIYSDGSVAVENPAGWRGAINAALANSAFYSATGIIVKAYSGTGTVEGYGRAVVNIRGKTVTVDFEAQITTAGSISGQYAIGISVATLRALNSDIPNFTVANGGIIHYFTSSGAIATNREGYSGTTVVQSTPNAWQFARVYDTSGSVGAWGDDIYTVGMRVTGTLYGTLS